MSDIAGTLRADVLKTLTSGAKTADEIADILRQSVLAIRPRVTELKQMGFIVDTGQRRANRSRRRAAVVRLSSQTEPK